MKALLNAISQNELMFNQCKLTVNTVSREATIPIVSTTRNNLIINITPIQCIDACGLAWLLELYERYKSLGLRVHFTENHIVQDALVFLGISLPLQTNTLIKKEAI